MISSLDFLYICLGVGVLVLVAVTAFLIFSLASFLITLKTFIKEINLMKDGLKLGILGLAEKLLSRRR